MMSIYLRVTNELPNSATLVSANIRLVSIAEVLQGMIQIAISETGQNGRL